MPNDSSQSIAIDNPAKVLAAAANKSQATKGRPDPMILKLIRFAFRVGGAYFPSHHRAHRLQALVHTNTIQKRLHQKKTHLNPLTSSISRSTITA